MSQSKDRYISSAEHGNARWKVEYGDGSIDDNEVDALLDSIHDDPDEFFAMAKGRHTRWESKYGYWYTITRTGDHTITISK